jgi:hypothetical protein
MLSTQRLFGLHRSSQPARTGARYRRLHPALYAAVPLIVVAAVLGAGIASASASTPGNCESDWCSGADGDTAANVQGNAPQIYLGEIGSYTHDFDGISGPCPQFPGGLCFDNSTAENAYARWNTSHPTGMGVQYFYLLGGYDTNRGGLDAYCWGWAQGQAAISEVESGDPSDYIPSAYFIVADIEDSSWSSSYTADDRLVFNGFADYVAGKSSADSGCTSTNPLGPFQYAVYSAPDVFNPAFGSSGDLPNTPIWTWEYYCRSTWPGGTWTPSSNSSLNAQFDWASSKYHWGWQFYNTCSSPDYDEFYEPMYMAVYGTDWGTQP